jgi:hypothetical protein
MSRNDWRSLIILIHTAAVFCFVSQAALAQETPGTAASAVKPNETLEAVRELADTVRDLKARVESLHAQIGQMQTEQQRSNSEIRELRVQLKRANTQQASLRPGTRDSADGSSSVAAETYSSISPEVTSSPVRSTTSRDQAAPETQTVEQRLDRLDENQQFIDAKVNDQEQTKIESSSKYRLRLSGIALLNLFSNRGTVDNTDFPAIASGLQPLGSNSSIGGSLRQSQIGIEGFGPDLAGAHTSANVKFDFAGGSPKNPNGAAMGLVRLRTGTFRMDWTNTSIVAGQDVLFFAPLAPTSIATLAVPALSYAGKLWSWTPQVRVEHRVTLSENSHLVLQGGVLDPLSGDVPADSYERTSSSGEQSGQPAVAGRIAWSQSTFGKTWTLGAGAYHARQNWGFHRNVDAWASTIDFMVPLTRLFELSGEYYRGRAIGGLGGAIGQSVLLSGALTDPATTVHGLDSLGGWTQLKVKLRPNFQVNGAFGQDNPFASQMRSFPVTVTPYDEALARNRSWFVNFIYQPRSNLLVSLEFRRLKTLDLDPEPYNANHVNLSVGYVF